MKSQHDNSKNMKNYPASKVTDKGEYKPYAILKIIRKEDPKIINLEYTVLSYIILISIQ